MSTDRSRRRLRPVGWGRITLPWTRRRLEDAEEFAQQLLAEAIARKEPTTGDKAITQNIATSGEHAAPLEAKTEVDATRGERLAPPYGPSVRRESVPPVVEHAPGAGPTRETVRPGSDLPLGVAARLPAPRTGRSWVGEDDEDARLGEIPGLVEGVASVIVPPDRWAAYRMLLEGVTSSSRAEAETAADELRLSLIHLESNDKTVQATIAESLVRLAQTTTRAPQVLSTAAPLYTAMLTEAERILAHLEDVHPGEFSSSLSTVVELRRAHAAALGRRRDGGPSDSGAPTPPR